MSTDATSGPDDIEVPEADAHEQRQAAGYGDEEGQSTEPLPEYRERAVPEASDGDLAEQSREVRFDEDDEFAEDEEDRA